MTADVANRYLINSPMLPQLKRDADGGVTLIVQNESPGKDKEAKPAASAKGTILHDHASLLAESNVRQVEATATAANGVMFHRIAGPRREG